MLPFHRFTLSAPRVLLTAHIHTTCLISYFQPFLIFTTFCCLVLHYRPLLISYHQPPRYFHYHPLLISYCPLDSFPAPPLTLPPTVQESSERSIDQLRETLGGQVEGLKAEKEQQQLAFDKYRERSRQGGLLLWLLLLWLWLWLWLLLL